ncbi:hypothetical protein CC86DRAFT_386557 [Ophiobolus disseminans]|uniref:Uncharacterized protein n=1 Tax=Ophiobolus disseminans TaxID=1469910 RepID=A0A6A6ZJX7_9PLEO|nr:hypothetical protein CC86DRAFT_386557 [Ophiobolus disseminans]
MTSTQILDEAPMASFQVDIADASSFESVEMFGEDTREATAPYISTTDGTPIHSSHTDSVKNAYITLQQHKKELETTGQPGDESLSSAITTIFKALDDLTAHVMELRSKATTRQQRSDEYLGHITSLAALLEKCKQDLHTVSEKLEVGKQHLHSVSDKLQASKQHLHSVLDKLVHVEDEHVQAEQRIWGLENE